MNRHDRFLSRLAAQIATRGYAVPRIGPDPGTGHPAYAYTAGLHVTHGYELAISGLPPEIAGGVLDLLAAALPERGTTPAQGLVVEGLLHDGYSIRLHRVRDVGTPSRFRWIGDLFPSLPAPPAIWQALWPDSAHHFPGDTDCQITAEAQVLL